MSQTNSFELRRARNSDKKGQPLPGLDMHLFLPILLLVAFGIIMVFSASYPSVTVGRKGSYYYVIRQFGFAAVGALAFWFFSRIRLGFLRRYAYLLFALSVMLLIAVLAKGRLINGARSWFSFGPVSFQPSEMAKICLMLALAKFLADHPYSVNTLKGLLPAIVMAGMACGLVLKGKDFGTTTVMGLAFLVLLFLAGAKRKHIAGLLTSATVIGGIFIAKEPYRLMRIISFINPEKYAKDEGYQTIRQLIALGSGGPFGVGFSHSREKFFYLPGQTPFTDSIYAIIGEELGIIACLTILALFLWLGWRGLSIAAASKDRFISLTAAGLTSIILIGAAINILVNLDMMPLTGLPLPFISYGGSSLLFSLIAIGIVAGISRQLPRLAATEEKAPAAKVVPPASAAGGGGQERMRSRSLRPRGL